MRNVSTGVRRTAALVTVLALLVVPAVYADEEPPPPPTEDPQARIHPPIGVAGQSSPRAFELFIIWLLIYARVSPPIG